jgi:hypothetical protein
VAVLDIDPASRDAAAEHTFDRARHRRAGLPRPNNLNPIETRGCVAPAARSDGSPVELEVAQHGGFGVGRGQRCAKNLKCVFAAH